MALCERVGLSELVLVAHTDTQAALECAQESQDRGSNPSSVAVEFCDLWQHATSGSENVRFLLAFLTVAPPEGMCEQVGM